MEFTRDGQIDDVAKAQQCNLYKWHSRDPRAGKLATLEPGQSASWPIPPARRLSTECTVSSQH